MSGIANVAAIVCVSSLACSILGAIAPPGLHKKLTATVMGLFIICVMINPIRELCSGSFDFGVTVPQESVSEENARSAYEEAVLAETESSLEATLSAMLAQRKIDIISLKINLGINGDGGIYVASVRIYIPERSYTRSSEIRSLVSEQLSREPEIIKR